jgi:hypothetical protein
MRPVTVAHIGKQQSNGTIAGLDSLLRLIKAEIDLRTLAECDFQMSHRSQRQPGREIVMHDYRQDSAYIANGLTVSILKTLTPADQATHRRWIRALLAFYCSLFLLGGIVILANHSSANSSNMVAQASMPRKAP